MSLLDWIPHIYWSNFLYSSVISKSFLSLVYSMNFFVTKMERKAIKAKKRKK